MFTCAVEFVRRIVKAAVDVAVADELRRDTASTVASQSTVTASTFCHYHAIIIVIVVIGVYFYYTCFRFLDPEAGFQWLRTLHLLLLSSSEFRFPNAMSFLDRRNETFHTYR